MKKFLLILLMLVSFINTYSQEKRAGRNTLFRMRMTTSVNANWSDEAVVVFRPTATRGYDRQFDAAKMSGSFMNISTMPVVGQKMIINSMPEMTAQREDLVLDVNGSVDGQYNINFNGFENMDPTAVMYLRDNFLGTVTPIYDGLNYPFNINNTNPATHGAGRFVITYGLGSPTSIEDRIVQNLKVYPNPSSGILYIEYETKDVFCLSIYNNIGTKVMDISLNPESKFKEVDLNRLSNGVYILSSSKEKIRERVVINK